MVTHHLASVFSCCTLLSVFDERGMKTNVAVEKINPSILIHVQCTQKDQDNVDEDKRDDLCHMVIEICVCE